MKLWMLVVSVNGILAAAIGKTSYLLRKNRIVKNMILSLCLALPKFEMLGTSRSNIPDISVTFENGENHEMILEPYTNSPCNFIGTLKNLPSSVAVTGCMNSPGDTIHITLLSELNQNSPMYEMDYDGYVTALESPFQHQKGFISLTIITII